MTDNRLWVDGLLRSANIKSNQAATGRSLLMSEEWTDLSNAAAAQRGLRATPYMCRALMAFVVHDLNLDYDEVMEEEPYVMAVGPTASGKRAHYRGRGFGDWEIGWLKKE